MTHPDQDTTRRSFLRTAAGTAAAAVTVPAFAATQAFAARSPHQVPPPPPIGAEIPCDMHAVNTPITVGTWSFGVDLRGEVRLRVERASPVDPWDIRLRIIGFRVSGEHRTGGRASGLGRITLEHSDTETTPDGRLQLVSRQPPKWKQTMFLDFTMTIERPPPELGGAAPGRAPEPLVLSTRAPGKLVGRLTGFPPKGEIYQLQHPIDLIAPDDPGQTIASIATFPVKVGRR